MLKRSRQELSKNSDSSLLLRDIQKVKSELDCAYSNFENAVEPDLIDCYIYQLKSAQMRYKFLLIVQNRQNCREKEETLLITSNVSSFMKSADTYNIHCLTFQILSELLPDPSDAGYLFPDHIPRHCRCYIRL